MARALQDLLPGVWLRLGVDDLVDAAPVTLLCGGGLEISGTGDVGVGLEFTTVEGHWMAGVAAMARHGGRVIVEDNFVSGPLAQQRWAAALNGVETRWVAVRCSAEVAARREAARGDRIVGMAAGQADSVHRDIHYDLVIDTDDTPGDAACRNDPTAVLADPDLTGGDSSAQTVTSPPPGHVTPSRGAARDEGSADPVADLPGCHVERRTQGGGRQRPREGGVGREGVRGC